MPNRNRRHGRRTTNHRLSQAEPHNQHTRTQQPRNRRQRPRRGSFNPRPQRGSQRQRQPSTSSSSHPYTTPQSQLQHHEYLRQLNFIHKQGTNALRELGDLMHEVRDMQNVIRNGQTMDWEPHSTIVFEGVSLPPRTALVGCASSTSNSGREDDRDGPVSSGGVPRGPGAQSSAHGVVGEELSAGQADESDVGIAEE